MAQKVVEILIDEDGNPEITTKGFKGGECAKFTAELVKDFGGEVKSDVPTAEMRQGGQANATVTAR